MALHTRRVITPVEDISARTLPRRVPSRSTAKPLQVSFATPSARRPLQRAGAPDKPAPQSNPKKDQTVLLTTASSSSQNHSQTRNQAEKVISGHEVDSIPTFVNSSSNVEEPLYESTHCGHKVTEDVQKENQREPQDSLYPVAEISESGLSTNRGSGNTESYYDGQNDPDHDQNLGLDVGEDQEGHSHERKPKLNQQEWRSMATFAKAQGVDLMKQVEEQKRQRLEYDQETPDIAKAEMEEMRRILRDRRRSSDEYLIPSETEGDSSPERNSRRKRNDSVDRYSRRDSTELEINDQIDAIKKEDLSKVLDWLKSADKEMDNRIAASEDRTLSLLQAIKEGNVGFVTGSLGGFEEDWVPMERLREAERRSSIAEEQIQHFEELLNATEGADGDEQLCVLLSRSKSMERHFHHLKKFAEDRHAELRKFYPVADKDATISWRPHSGASPEKVRRDVQEHENHKKRLMQVFSMYNDLLKFLRVEHSKRIEAESKSQQLTSQIKRQTVALKKAEKVIKHSAFLPVGAKESNYYGGISHGESKGSLARPSPSPSGMQSPTMASYSTQPSPFTFSSQQSRAHLPEDQEGDFVKRLDSARFDQGMPALRRINTTGNSNRRVAALPSSTTTPMAITKELSYDHALEQALSRNPSPDPGAVLSNSDLIAQNHKKEFEDLERALIEEGRLKGFADVDLYSERKTVGRDETCWEYRHVHLDFIRPHQVGTPSTASREQKWDTLDLESLNNLSISKRTASPSRSEGAAFEDKHNHQSADGPHKHLASIHGTGHDQHLFSLVKSNAGGHDDNHHSQKPRQQDEISAKLVGSAMTDHENAVARIHCEAGSDKNTGIVINKMVKVEEIPRSTSAKHLDKKTIDKQKKVFRRMQSSPAKIMSSQTENSHLLHGKAGDQIPIRALGGSMVMEDGLEEDVPQDASDKMWVDVGDDELWSDATAKEEWANMAEDHSNNMTQSCGMSSDDMGLARKTEGQRVQQRPHGSQPSDLQRRVAAVESGHVTHLLQAQVKQRRWLLLFQVVLLMVAFLWSATWWWGSMLPPPT